MTVPRVLTIAGSDPSGGAGLQADLKTFLAHRCYGMAAVTVLTAQNTVGVRGVHAPPAEFLDAQIRAIVDDCPPVATKTGMLFSREIVEVVARWAESGALGQLVVDPVMVATSGDRLLSADAEASIMERLLPSAALVTPNVPEAVALLGSEVRSGESVETLALTLSRRLGRAVLVKGGHGSGALVRDALATRDGVCQVWERARLDVGEAHGTGCTLSAAIAARLARGDALSEAVAGAGDFVHRGLASAFRVGNGAVPVDHMTPADSLR